MSKPELVSPDYRFNGQVVDMRHVTKDSKNKNPGSQASAGIDNTSDDGIAVTVMIELVVRAKCGKSTSSNTV